MKSEFDKEIDCPLPEDEMASARKWRSPKFKSYKAFFAAVQEQGEFECFDYDEDVKKEIVGDFIPVLTGSGDPLERALEDILATAKLREVRVFPENEYMYVRCEVRFLDEQAAWGEPCQLLALWDCFNRLHGYTFVRGTAHESFYPAELTGNETAARQAKRRELQARRQSVSHENDSPAVHDVAENITTK